MQLNVTPDSVENEYYYTGFASYGARQKVSPISVIGYAFKEVGYSVNTVVKSLGMMFTGQAVSYTHLDVYKRQILYISE